MVRRQIYDYFFLTLLGFVLYGVLKVMSPFAGPLLVALLCAVIFYPLYNTLHRRFPKLSPSFHAAILDLLVFVFFVTPVILLGWAIVQESTMLTTMMKQGSATVAQWRDGNVLESAPWMAQVRFFVSKAFGVQQAPFQDSVVGWLNAALGYLSLSGTVLAKHAVLLLINLMIMLFALFFMFRDGERIGRWIQSHLPIRHQHQEELGRRVHDSMVGIARGLFLTSLIQGIAATLGYLIVGAEGAVLLGAMTAFAGLIPVVGTLGMWVPVSFFFFFRGSYWKGVFLLCWGAVVVVGLIDTLLRPYLVGKKMELPLFALFFALLGGAEVWGAKGLILGPLLIAVTPVLLHIYRENYLRRSEGTLPSIRGNAGDSETQESGTVRSRSRDQSSPVVTVSRANEG